jgi:hypothetical protein
MDLPDIKAKVKVDTSGVAVADAELKTFARSVKDSMDTSGIEKFSQQSGRAFIKFGDDGKLASVRISSATAQTRADLDQLEARTRRFASGLEGDFQRGTTAIVKLGEDGQAALSNVERSMGNVGTATTGIGASLAGLGPVTLVLAAAIGTLTAALSLVVFPLTAYALGLAAALAIGTLVLGGLGGLAAGVIGLAAVTQGWLEKTKDVPTAEAAVADAVNAHQDAVLKLEAVQKQYNLTSQHTAAQDLALHEAQQKVADTALKLTKAQQDLTAAQTGAVNPLEVLKTHLELVADALGEKAAPMAKVLLGWLDKLLGPIQEVGSRLLDWFGERLPKFLPIATQVTKDFGEAVERLGKRLGPIFDDILQHPEKLEKTLKDTFNNAVDAVTGLLNRIDELRRWWDKNGPKLEATVNNVMSGIGTATLVTVQVLGQLSEAFNQVDRAIGPLITLASSALGPALAELAKHSETVRAVLLLVALAAGVLVVALLVLVGILILVGAELLREWDHTKHLRDGIAQLNEITLDIFLSAVSSSMSTARSMIRAVVDLVDRLTAAINQLPGFKHIQIDVGVSGAAPGSGFTGLTSPFGGGLQSGGPALPNRVYTVGEHGSETLVMGAAGGYVIPHGAGSSSGPTSVTINIIGAGMNPDQVAMAIDRRLSRLMTAT